MSGLKANEFLRFHRKSLVGCGILFALLFLGFFISRLLGLSDQDVQDVTMNLLCQPKFSGKEFQRQILPEGISFKILDLETGKAHFSQLNEMPLEEKILSQFLRNPKKIEESDLFPNSQCFAVDWKNFRVDPDLKLNYEFQKGQFKPSLRELAYTLKNSFIKGGSFFAKINRKTIILNHACYVSKYGDPPVQRFANQVVSNFSSREDKIQALLDIVTQEVSYNDSEAEARVETMKRAAETLMTRTADCTNKVVLFASLLEQIKEPYLLLYFNGHICVAVKLEAFPAENGLQFEAAPGAKFFEGEWTIAETTISGFKIGETAVQGGLEIEEILFIQNLKTSPALIDIKTGKALEFR